MSNHDRFFASASHDDRPSNSTESPFMMLFDWSLKEYFTPLLIRSTYMLSVVLWVISCAILAVPATASARTDGEKIMAIAVAIAGCFAGLVSLRVASEVAILLFAINDNLAEIARNSREIKNRKPADPVQPVTPSVEPAASDPVAVSPAIVNANQPTPGMKIFRADR